MELKTGMQLVGFIVMIGIQYKSYIKSNTIQTNELKHIGDDIKEIKTDVKKIDDKFDNHSIKLAEHDKAIEILEKK